MSNLLESVPLRWVVAVVAFPIGGYLGHLIAGPAATAPAAFVSGLVAGAIIGLGQGLALKLPVQALVTWSAVTAVTAVALALALAGLTAIIGQIETIPDAIFLGAASGLLIGAGQAALLVRQRVRSAWTWVLASTAAWAIGWLVTASIGVDLEAGWPVYGLSGALASQLSTRSLRRLALSAISSIRFWAVRGKGPKRSSISTANWWTCPSSLAPARRL